MKKLKNTISFLMCLALALTMVCVPVSVNAWSGDVLLDLDTARLTDKSGNDVEISVLGNVITGGSFSNVNGGTVNYMTTGNADDNLSDSKKAGALRITDPRITELTNYTIEMWMKYEDPVGSANAAKFPKPFRQTEGQYSLFTYEMPSSVNYPKLDAIAITWNGGNAKPVQDTVDQAGISGKWMHWVFTYETRYDSNGDIKGVYPKGYLNGVTIATNYKTEPEITSSAYLGIVGTGTEFTIGGTANGTGGFGMGFPGDFASFTIYDGVKTADEVADMYKTEKNTYIETTVDPSAITFEDGNQVAGQKNISLDMPDVYIEFGSDADMSTVNEDTIVFEDVSDGLPVSYSVEVEGRRAVVSVDDKLEKNKQYMVGISENVFNKDLTAYGQFYAPFTTVRAAYAGEGWKVEQSGKTVKAALNAKSDNDGGDYAQHILCVYQICDGYVLPVCIEKAADTVNTGTDLSLTADISALPAGKYRAVSVLRGDDLEICENETKAIEFTID